jgi:tRNA(Arg) A34 adenosine deaminase TadA
MLSTKLQHRLIEDSREILSKYEHNQQHCTFIIIRNTVLSYGVNNAWKSHTWAYKFGHRFSSIHSELNAITRFPYKLQHLQDCKMVNVRINRADEASMSRPCISCTKMLAGLDLREIWYSTAEGFVQL